MHKYSNFRELGTVIKAHNTLPDAMKRRKPPNNVRNCPKKTFAVGRGLSSADILRRGSSMRTYVLFGAKFFRIFMVCPNGQGGLSQCGHFASKRGGGQYFAILCGRLLSFFNFFFATKSMDERLHLKKHLSEKCSQWINTPSCPAYGRLLWTPPDNKLINLFQLAFKINADIIQSIA